MANLSHERGEFVVRATEVEEKSEAACVIVETLWRDLSSAASSTREAF